MIAIILGIILLIAGLSIIITSLENNLEDPRLPVIAGILIPLGLFLIIIEPKKLGFKVAGTLAVWRLGLWLWSRR